MDTKKHDNSLKILDSGDNPDTFLPLATYIYSLNSRF